MAVSGGDPVALANVSTRLSNLSSDLADDAISIGGMGKRANGAAEGEVGEVAETALAAVGGAVVAMSTLVEGLSTATRKAGEHLVAATGGPR